MSDGVLCSCGHHDHPARAARLPLAGAKVCSAYATTGGAAPVCATCATQHPRSPRVTDDGQLLAHSQSVQAALARYPERQRRSLVQRLRRGLALIKPGYEDHGVLDARTLLPINAAPEPGGARKGRGQIAQIGGRAKAGRVRAGGYRRAGQPASHMPKSLRR